ncbi:hypothetical protein GY45DRAFT_63382 [Cubamyces sp. BRFM 1775]|nr:hypothetical protein GY45DRAFT_63382 [Cubamyces sp. BRFM 1775]
MGAAICGATANSNAQMLLWPHAACRRSVRAGFLAQTEHIANNFPVRRLERNATTKSPALRSGLRDISRQIPSRLLRLFTPQGGISRATRLRPSDLALQSLTPGLLCQSLKVARQIHEGTKPRWGLVPRTGAPGVRGARSGLFVPRSPRCSDNSTGFAVSSKTCTTRTMSLRLVTNGEHGIIQSGIS